MTRKGAAPSRGKYAYKKRGAYRKKAKRQFKNARRPFVEGKTRSIVDVLKSNVPEASQINYLELSTIYPGYGEQTVPLDDAFTVFRLDSYMQQQRGLLDYQMIGNSIFVRYLKAKIKIDFPPVKVLVKPAKLYLIHGWITTPLNLTDVTTPTAATATMAQVNAHVNERLRQYFNDTQDQLLFRPKAWDNGIKVIRKQEIKPDIQEQFSIPSAQQNDTSGASYGAIPSVIKSCTWNVNRKVHYQDSTDGAGLDDHLYPNQGWLPFMCLYNPDFRHFDEDLDGRDHGNRIRILMNNQIWYSDS
jgi:hypothetical protein